MMSPMLCASDGGVRVGMVWHRPAVGEQVESVSNGGPFCLVAFGMSWSAVLALQARLHESAPMPDAEGRVAVDPVPLHRHSGQSTGTQRRHFRMIVDASRSR